MDHGSPLASTMMPCRVSVLVLATDQLLYFYVKNVPKTLVFEPTFPPFDFPDLFEAHKPGAKTFVF
jgi:hypothetical protein